MISINNIKAYENSYKNYTHSVNKNTNVSLDVKNNSTTNPFRVLPQGYAPINFGARAEDGLKPANPKLKAQMQYAEAVMNNMKNKYGFMSPSKVMFTWSSKPTQEQKEWLKEKQAQLQDLRRDYPRTSNKEEFIDNLIKNVTTKGTKIANCYESAKLAEIALSANGVKNISTVNLVGYTNPEFRSCYDLDHTFLIVNGDMENKNNANWDKPKERYGKNAYVVDPWLGIVDTVENAMKIYAKVWENIPHYNGIKGYGVEEAYNSALELEAKDNKKIKEKYPELVVDKNIDLRRYDK